MVALRSSGLARLGGDVVQPDDDDYERARRVWNTAVDRHPALIVRPRQVADVISAVEFARNNDLRLAVREGFKAAVTERDSPHGDYRYGRRVGG